MINKAVFEKVAKKFTDHYGESHSVAAYAPGRVEVLGNHTDYNEGYVLSAAINMGTFFLAIPSPDSKCRLVAADRDEEAIFDISSVTPSTEMSWANYVKGVFAGLSQKGEIKNGFLGMILGNIPLGAGLSSSAALEISAGLALSELYDIHVHKKNMAKIGQAAEHKYAGVKCGLLDQISSIYGRKNHLVMTDFRSLDVENVPFAGKKAGAEACFLMCNSNAKHTLADGVYNERRAKCEEAARFLAGVLKHPVKALRDVSWEELQEHSSKMDPVAAKRAAHVVGECTRVLKGKELLAQHKLEEFGKLMFESHESSINNFENSCEELDFIVAESKKIPGVMGARLSGGGFGGSAVILINPRDVDIASKAFSSAYEKEYGHTCDIRVIKPSAGAKLL
jgi:galactokinase